MISEEQFNMCPTGAYDGCAVESEDKIRQHTHLGKTYIQEH